jgi:hypothetical protein
MSRFLLLISLLFCISYNAFAEQTKPAIIPEPPELPAQIVSGENMSPDITITRDAKEDITEYRVNGQLYMVKISPKNAPAYYLVDTDGDGELETQHSDLQKGMNIPQWLILSW